MMDDLISRQDAIKEIDGLPNCYNGYSDAYDKSYIIGVLEELPSAEPEIIYCKDCKKHNMPKGHYYNGKYIGVKECCPLVLVRGLAQGHEFDYQYCAWAERRTDETD